MNPSMQQEDAARIKRQGAEQAINLALESKWEEAAAVNRSIVAAQPDDVEAWNRLGKALLELGRFRESRDAYSKSLELDPVNTIARRNLDRLSSLGDVEAPRRETAKVAQDLFIEEMGKSGTAPLTDPQREALVTMVAGDEVYLKPDGAALRVENAEGAYIGMVEPKVGLRLIRLMEGGNRYAAAIKTVSDGDAQLIIKETYRDPSQTRLSFPAAGTEGVRPYTKESLLRYDLEEEEEEEVEEETDHEEWEAESESQEGTFSLSTLKESLEGSDNDEEEEE